MKIFTLLFLILLSVQSSAQSVFTNKGTLVYVGENSSSMQATLYVNGSIQVETDGSFSQKGKTLLTGDFVNNATSGTVFSSTSTGLVEFKNTLNIRQTIKGQANKGTSYINFPDVTVNNSGAVLLEATMGMNVKNLDLTKGRLILDSKVKDARLVDNAHLLVNSSVSYNRIPAVAEDKGLVQVNLNLGDNYLSGKVIGFTPPFKKIYSDYLFYNVLTRPTAAGLTGDKKQLITDPRYGLEAGKGYIIGLGIIDTPEYWEDFWDHEWDDANHSDRVTEQFSFVRDFAPASFTQYATAPDRFTAEELNYQDVPVILEKGWNYLGNPFTVPLDLSALVNEVSVPDEWGVTRALTNAGDVNAKLYILSGGQGTFHSNMPLEPFRFSVSYLLGQKVGSTLELDNNLVDKLLIAPMQMFVIGVYDSGAGKTMTIPASKRTHANIQFYRTRNAPEEEQSVSEEFLIEVKDQTTEGFDRLTVVFREDASLASTDKYDAAKMFNNSKGVSQIYTPSSDGKQLTANIVSPSTKSLEMHLIPTTQTQEVSLGTYRLSSLHSVKQIILEDKITNIKTELTNNPTYTFTSSPTDRTDRFVLHFSKSGSGIDEEDNLNINTFYTSGNLKISNLLDSDIGSVISITDLQGRWIHQSTINENPEVNIPMLLNQGTYIIKLTGVRTYVTKILVSK